MEVVSEAESEKEMEITMKSFAVVAGQMEIKIRLLSNDRRRAKVSHSNRSFQTQSTAFRSEPFAPILADLFSIVWLVGF